MITVSDANPRSPADLKEYFPRRPPHVSASTFQESFKVKVHFGQQCSFAWQVFTSTPGVAAESAVFDRFILIKPSVNGGSPQM